MLEFQQLAVLILYCFITCIQTRIVLDKYEYCTEYEMPLNVVPGEILENDKQLISLNFNLSKDMGDNTKVDLLIELQRADNSWKQLIKTVLPRGVCHFYNTYGSGLWFGIQRAVNMPEKVCPFAAGYYSSDRVELNFKKMNLPPLPKGYLKIKAFVLDKQTNKVLMCPTYYVKTG